MNAGRELDALVAEKVMGLKRLKHPHPTCQSDEFDFYEGDGRECPTCHYDGLWGSRSPKPYSTSIAAAWEVVERVRKHCIQDVLSLYGPSDECNNWIAMFEKKYSGRNYSNIYDGASGDTAPHAICLAALKAMDAQCGK